MELGDLEWPMDDGQQNGDEVIFIFQLIFFCILVLALQLNLFP